jgi:hypothetical protein
LTEQACRQAGTRAAERSSVELADIVRAFGAELRRVRALTPEQHQVLGAIARCRTASLGGHVEVCLECGQERPIYNSCRNRHCPKCQALAQARWVEARSERLLPVPYFHVVFTLPAELRTIAKQNRQLVFNALFQAASETLLELALDPKRLGARLGVTAVLHTWTRELDFHPHLHCIVTGGGFDAETGRWVAGNPRHLLPVRVLGVLFREKLLDSLSRLERANKLRLPEPPGQRDPQGFDRLMGQLHRKAWVVYAKRPFGGPEAVFRYLGRYTHRVGLSNRRLVSLDERGVTFRTKNGKALTLEPVAFLSRFVEHVLPSGFVKIRHYGLLAPKHVSTLLVCARAVLSAVNQQTASPAPTPTAASIDENAPDDYQDRVLALTGVDLGVCLACGARSLQRRPLIEARGPPSGVAA